METLIKRRRDREHWRDWREGVLHNVGGNVDWCIIK